jgi:hypothetical protein
MLNSPRGVEAYDRNERLLGVFRDAIEAARAVEDAIEGAA